MDKVSRVYVYISQRVYSLILSCYYDANNHEVYQHHEDLSKVPKCFCQKGNLTT